MWYKGLALNLFYLLFGWSSTRSICLGPFLFCSRNRRMSQEQKSSSQKHLAHSWRLTAILPPRCLSHISPSCHLKARKGFDNSLCCCFDFAYRNIVSGWESTQWGEKRTDDRNEGVHRRSWAHTQRPIGELITAAVPRAASLPLRPVPEPVAGSRGQQRHTFSKFLLQGHSTENSKLPYNIFLLGAKIWRKNCLFALNICFFSKSEAVRKSPAKLLKQREMWRSSDTARDGSVSNDHSEETGVQPCWKVRAKNERVVFIKGLIRAKLRGILKSIFYVHINMVS